MARNKRGKVVSKRASACGKRAFKQIESWVEAIMAAREAFHTQGFVAINGKTLQGKALYAKAKTLYSQNNVGRSVAPSIVGSSTSKINAFHPVAASTFYPTAGAALGA